MNQTIFRVGIYLRVSREDKKTELQEESNSIQNQRLLLFRYLKGKEELQLEEEYVDDGYSGANFDRPGFRQMQQDMEAGKINCVVVKDLSRFGRNYLKSGWYIEHFFPQKKIRFISVSEQYDSAISQQQEMLLPFYNLLNEGYLEDISGKIRGSLKAKWETGLFTGNFAPYGYRKQNENHNQLEVDREAALVVKQIFHWYLQGISPTRIASRLEECCIASPMEYKREHQIGINENFLCYDRARWSASAVIRILENQVYTGALLQGKTRVVGVSVKKPGKRDKEQWVVSRDCQKAIISQELFHIVERLRNMDMRSRPGKTSVSLLAGLVKCSRCGQNMVRKTGKGKKNFYSYYICSSHKRGEGCVQKSISYEGVEQIVIHALERLAVSWNRSDESKLDKEWKRLIEVKLRQRREELKQLQKALFEQKEGGTVLSKEMQIEFKERIEKGLEAVAAEWKKQGGRFEERKKESADREGYKREHILVLLQEIQVGDNQEVSLIFSISGGKGWPVVQDENRRKKYIGPYCM